MLTKRQKTLKILRSTRKGLKGALRLKILPFGLQEQVENELDRINDYIRRHENV